MSTWTRIDWSRTDDEASRRALALTQELAELEGELSPLLPGELLTELQEDGVSSLWYAGDELVSIGLLRPDGVFRTALRPEHREMSLFLPMLAWAESVRSERYPDSLFQVIAQDEDVCLPFLLLRLDFAAADPGFTRTDDPYASVFRHYVGGRVHEEPHRAE